MPRHLDRWGLRLFRMPERRLWGHPAVQKVLAPEKRDEPGRTEHDHIDQQELNRSHDHADGKAKCQPVLVKLSEETHWNPRSHRTSHSPTHPGASTHVGGGRIMQPCRRYVKVLQWFGQLFRLHLAPPPRTGQNSATSLAPPSM